MGRLIIRNIGCVVSGDLDRPLLVVRDVVRDVVDSME